MSTNNSNLYFISLNLLSLWAECSWLFVPWKRCGWQVMSRSYFTSCSSKNTDFRQTKTRKIMTGKSRKRLLRRASESQFFFAGVLIVGDKFHLRWQVPLDKLLNWQVGFGINCMVPSDWDWAPNCVCGPKFRSYSIGESPIFLAAGIHEFGMAKNKLFLIQKKDYILPEKFWTMWSIETRRLFQVWLL